MYFSLFGESKWKLLMAKKYLISVQDENNHQKFEPNDSKSVTSFELVSNRYHIFGIIPVLFLYDNPTPLLSWRRISNDSGYGSGSDDANLAGRWNISWEVNVTSRANEPNVIYSKNRVIDRHGFTRYPIYEKNQYPYLPLWRWLFFHRSFSWCLDKREIITQTLIERNNNKQKRRM